LSRRKDSELLVISLYEIDRELEDRREPSSPKDTKLAPNEYRGFSDVFSKEASDKLPPYRSYDYQIVLEKPASKLGFGPLWN
jgi:hypothetical protein